MSNDAIEAATRTYWKLEIDRLKALYGLEGEEIIPLSGDEAAEFERLNTIYGKQPFHVFMLESAKFHGDMMAAEFGEILKKTSELGEGWREIIDQLKRQNDELRQAVRRIDPNEFISAAQVIRNLPAPKVRIYRGLSQFVSKILTTACERKGVRYEQFNDGFKLFPVAVIDEEKLAGLEDDIRGYAAGLKLRQILPFAPVKNDRWHH